jgi:putative ABC transport system permease protein
MSRRTREIGVRMALGATRGAMLREMMRESMAVTAVGLAVGLVLALAVGRILSSLLYEVSATDPWAFLGATAFLALAATVASWLPIERALRVQPSAALRHE